MNSILNDKIKDYDLKLDSKTNIAKEIIQKICLSTLFKTDFYKNCFYGLNIIKTF